MSTEDTPQISGVTVGGPCDECSCKSYKTGHTKGLACAIDRPERRHHLQAHGFRSHELREETHYRIINAKHGTVIDVDSYTKEVVHAWEKGPSTNQQWNFVKNDSAYLIVHVGHGTYLAPAGVLANCQRLIATPIPFHWHLKRLQNGNYRIYTTGPTQTQKVINLLDQGKSILGNVIQLWDDRSADLNQEWKIELV